MTAMAAVAVPLANRNRAPLVRLLVAELRFMLRRPRTLFALGVVALLPIAAGVGISVASTSDTAGPGGQAIAGIAAIVADNGLILPVFALLLAVVMLLPMIGAMWASDAIAGEAAAGGLRNLLLAPVGRVRLLGVKAFGVAVLSLLAVLVMAVVGTIAGMAILGGDGMLTVSGSTLSFWPSIGRIVLLAGLVTLQVWAVAAVALAISACTDHPLVVLATTLGGIIVFTLLDTIPALDWLQPVLITHGWDSLADVVRDPMPTGGLVDNVVRAGCYIVIGLSLALARMVTRDG